MLEMLRGADGKKISTMRIATLAVVFSVLGVFIAHNIISMFNGGGFVSIGYEESSLLALVLGAKATQTFAEVGGNKAKVEKLPDNVLPDGK